MDTEQLVKQLDSMPKQEAVDGILSRVDGIDTKLAELGKPPEVDPNTDPSAELRKGFFDDIMSFQVWGIPVGQAAVGGFVAIFVSEIIDGFMKDQQPWQRGLAKLGAAGVAGMWGKRFLGSTGAKAVALLLTFDAFRDLSPIDSWADQLAEKISGTVTTAGLAGPQTGGNPINVNAGARPTGGQSFYSQAMGG